MHANDNAVVKAISTIMEGFDFNGVRAFMSLSGWAWGAGTETPTVAQIRHTAYMLLTELAGDDEASSLETGGFRAERIISRNGSTELKLTFGLQTCSAEVLQEQAG